MFAMPMMLLGLSAAVIPIVIHLLNRRKTLPLDWAAMLFLQSSETHRKQRKTPDHWILMALRILLLLLLALLLAMPVIPAGGMATIGRNTPTDVVVVMDHSISSGLVSGRRTVFQHSIATLQHLVRHLSSGDGLSVVVAGHRPYSLTTHGILVADRSTIHRRLITPLEHLHAGLSGSSIPEAIGYAMRVAQRGNDFKKVIVVISNNRSVSWKIGQRGLWQSTLAQSSGEKIPVYNLPIPVMVSESDVAVGPLHVAPAVPGAGHPARILFTVSNSGPLPVSNISLRLLIDGKPVAVRKVTHLAAGSSEAADFKYRFEQAGSHWIQVRTNFQDSLAADNASEAAVHVWKQLPVLIIDHQPGEIGRFRSSRFLAAALNPSSRLGSHMALAAVKVVSITGAAAMRLRHYDVVIVNDPSTLPGALLTRLDLFARRGHGVWIIAGSRTNLQFLNSQLGAHGLSVGVFGPPESARHPPLLVIRDRESSIVKPLLQIGHNQIVGVTLKHWWKLTPEANQTRIIIATGAGAPIVVERPIGAAGGNLLVWTTGVDNQFNDWPTAAGSFVPLVNQSVYSLALSADKLADQRDLNSGGMLVWSGPSTPTITSAQLTLPSHRIIAVHPQLEPGNHYLVTSNHTGEPGLYQLNFTPKRRGEPIYYSVGIDPRQLDPAVLSAADLHWLVSQGYLKKTITLKDIGGVVGSGGGGMSLWPLMALLMLLALVLEGWMCRRVGKLQTDDDPAAMSEAGMTAAFLPEVPR